MNIRAFPHALLFLLCLWLPAEYFVFGKYSVSFLADNMELIVPRLMAMRFFESGNSLWDPFAGGGTDRVTYLFLGQVDVFLFNALPAWLAHSLRVSSQIVVAFLAVYALARRVFGFSPGPSMFAGAAYALTIQAILINSTFGYMPAVLLSLSWLLDRKTDIKRWLFVGLAIYVVAETAFFSRLVPYASLLIVMWFLFADPRRGYKDWAIILASSGLVSLLRVEDFIALQAVYPVSQLPITRVPSDLDAVLSAALNPRRLFGDPYSAVTMSLFIYALVVRRLGDYRMKGILAWIVLMHLFPPVVVAAQNAAASVLPFLRGAELERAFSVVRVAMAFAGAYGIQALFDQMKAPEVSQRFGCWIRKAAVAAAVGVLAFMSIKTKYAGLLNWVTHGSYVHAFESPVLKNLATTVRAGKFPERVEPFQLPSAQLNGYGLETAGAYHTVYGRRYFEFWSTMVEPWASRIDPNHWLSVAMARRRAATGDWPFFRGNRLYLFPEVYRPRVRISDFYRLNLLSLLNVSYLISRDVLVDDALVPVREMDAPWSSLDRRRKAAINIRGNFTGRQHLYVYRNQNAFPRFFTVPRIKTFATGRQVMEAVAGASIAELRTAAFVEKKVLPAGVTAEQLFGAAAIRLDEYTADEIRLKVEGEVPSLLIVANGYSPFWTCEIDGARTAIFPAYHALWGVVVPAGAKSMVFRYRPPYRRWFAGSSASRFN